MEGASGSLDRTFEILVWIVAIIVFSVAFYKSGRQAGRDEARHEAYLQQKETEEELKLEMGCKIVEAYEAGLTDGERRVFAATPSPDEKEE